MALLQIRESIKQTVIRLGDEYINPKDLLVKYSVQTKDQKVNTAIKKQRNFKDLVIRRKL